MKKKVIGYIFGVSLLALFAVAIASPKITGMAINIIKDYPINLHTMFTLVLASSVVISGIAYHRAIDIVEAKRDKHLKKLDEYISHCLSIGRNEYSVKQELIAYGWHESYINDSFDFLKSGKSIIDFHNYSKYINKR